MRTQLFRTNPVLVDAAGVVVALKDVDGSDLVTLFLENSDIAAATRTNWGSKNAQLRHVAVGRGSVGDEIEIVYTSAPSQPFSVVVTGGLPYATTVTVALRCDQDGRPNQLASAVMDLLSADGPTAALVRTTLAPGSDGSATVDYVDIVTDDGAHTGAATFTLVGGFDATDTGAVTVEYSPTGAAPRPLVTDPDFPGPWVADGTAGSALSTVVANAVKSYTFNLPVRGLRVKVSKGASDTTVVLTAIVSKKI